MTRVSLQWSVLTTTWSLATENRVASVPRSASHWPMVRPYISLTSLYRDHASCSMFGMTSMNMAVSSDMMCVLPLRRDVSSSAMRLVVILRLVFFMYMAISCAEQPMNMTGATIDKTTVATSRWKNESS